MPITYVAIGLVLLGLVGVAGYAVCSQFTIWTVELHDNRVVDRDSWLCVATISYSDDDSCIFTSERRAPSVFPPNDAQKHIRYTLGGYFSWKTMGGTREHIYVQRSDRQRLLRLATQRLEHEAGIFAD